MAKKSSVNPKDQFDSNNFESTIEIGKTYDMICHVKSYRNEKKYA
jgi:hypothetical protein